jgi:hypothetical protein
MVDSQEDIANCTEDEVATAPIQQAQVASEAQSAAAPMQVVQAPAAQHTSPAEEVDEGPQPCTPDSDDDKRSGQDIQTDACNKRVVLTARAAAKKKPKIKKDSATQTDDPVADDNVYTWSQEWRDPDVVFEIYGTEGHAKPSSVKHKRGKFTDCHGFTKGRNWDDPDHNWCSGHNGHLLYLLVQDEECEKVLKELKAAILEPDDGFGDEEKPLHHGLRCKHARHRSVAAAIFGRHCLQKFHGLKVNIACLKTVECGCPTNCKKLKQFKMSNKWKADTRKKWAEDGKAALHLAERIWVNS